MPYELGNDIHKLFCRYYRFMLPRSYMGRYGARIFKFTFISVFKSDGEGLQWIREQSRHHCADQTRIQSTAQKQPHGDIAHEMAANRIFDKFCKTLYIQPIIQIIWGFIEL